MVQQMTQIAIGIATILEKASIMLTYSIAVLSILFTCGRARIDKGYLEVLPLPRLCSRYLSKIAMRFQQIQDAAFLTTLAVSMKAFNVREAQEVWIFGESPVGVQSVNLRDTVHPTVTEANSFFQVQVS